MLRVVGRYAQNVVVYRAEEVLVQPRREVVLRKDANHVGEALEAQRTQTRERRATRRGVL